MSSILTGRRTLVVASLGAGSEVDRVFIEGLEVDTVIGVYDWERGIRQCLRLDLTLGWGNREYNLTVSAVIKDVPFNSHLQFDFLVPFQLLEDMRTYFWTNGSPRILYFVSAMAKVIENDIGCSFNGNSDR